MEKRNNPSASGSMTDRKTIERNRRNQMKALYSTLSSLVPHQKPVESTSLPDQLEEAAKHIKRLQIKLDRMKEKKEMLLTDPHHHQRQCAYPPPSAAAASAILSGGSPTAGADLGIPGGTDGLAIRSSLPPQIDIHEMGNALQVLLITGLDFQYMFLETIRLLHENGLEILSASFNLVDDNTIFHTIHSKIGDSGAAGISERLKKFVQDHAPAF